MKQLTFLLIASLLLSSLTSADGGGWYYTYATDSFSPMTQTKQLASIDYQNGREELLIAINANLQGDKAVWIFPIPATPEKTQIDVVNEFPKYGGYEIKSKAGYTIHGAPTLMLASQIVAFPLGFILWQLGVYNGAGGGGGASTGSDSGVVVHEHLDKMGLITELVTAKSEEEFNLYLREKNLTLPANATAIMREYIGKDYSFVVSWISNVEEYKKNVRGNILAVKTSFPTNRIYYPLRLTSVYGQKTVPMTVYVKGYVTPEFYEQIKSGSSFAYYANDAGLRYTKVRINTKSSNFIEDLWISQSAPLELIMTDFIATQPTISMMLLFAIYSCLASLIAGLIVFRKEVSPKKLALLGLANFLTLLGLSMAVIIALKKEGENSKEKKKYFQALITVTLFLALFVSLYMGFEFLRFLGVFMFFVLLFSPFIVVLLLLRISAKKSAYIILFSIIFLLVSTFSNQLLSSAYPLNGVSYRGVSNFYKIKPLSYGDMQMNHSGEFSVVFVNAVGTKINITNVELSFETPPEYYCEDYTVKTPYMKTGVDPYDTPVTVDQGGTFTIETINCSKGSGIMYSSTVRIDYVTQIGGFTRTGTEEGHLAGPIG